MKLPKLLYDLYEADVILVKGDGWSADRHEYWFLIDEDQVLVVVENPEGAVYTTSRAEGLYGMVSLLEDDTDWAIEDTTDEGDKYIEGLGLRWKGDEEEEEEDDDDV